MLIYPSVHIWIQLECMQTCMQHIANVVRNEQGLVSLRHVKLLHIESTNHWLTRI